MLLPFKSETKESYQQKENYKQGWYQEIYDCLFSNKKIKSL